MIMRRVADCRDEEKVSAATSHQLGHARGTAPLGRYTGICMFPYINFGSWHIGTFGLLLWLAAVCATVILHYNFKRNGVDADALNIVALSVVAGIVGAKLWH